MRRLLILLFSSFLFADLDLSQPFLSSPEEIATLTAPESSLIDSIISPLSGQLALRMTDIVARGAQDVAVSRTYIPPHIAFSNGNGYDDFLNRCQFFLNLRTNYRGWTHLHHVTMSIFNDSVHYVDPGGITLNMSLKDGTVLTPPFGMSNASGDEPSGHYDLRNTKLIKQDDQVSIFCPDGTERIYRYKLVNNIYQYLLEKEILPNGKVLRYAFDSTSLTIKSLDPLERYVYATVRIESNGHDRLVTTNTGDQAGYTNEPSFTHREEFPKSKGHDHGKYDFELPRVTTKVSSPFYRHEKISYNPYLQLTSFAGKEFQFTCDYNQEQPRRVERLWLPVGENDAPVDLYKMTYDSPIAGQKSGTTTAVRKDGLKTEYRYTKNLLLESILYYAPDGKLKKQKSLKWDESNRLNSLEWRDGDSKLFYETTFKDYDSFGNPRTEKFCGDLTGEALTEEYVIKREYSQDNRNLLLREENEEGKITTYEYLQNTNLPRVKLTIKEKKILLREFWDYDDCANLIETVIDNGSSKDKKELTGVTQRIVTQYRLRSEQPFLHMPEWIEEKYWDGKEEQWLKKAHLEYDRWGNVKVEQVHGSDEKEAYKIIREYDEQGNLLLEVNPLGYKATTTYDPKGLLKTAINFSGRLEKRRDYDARNRIKTVNEVDLEKGATHQTVFEYSSLDHCKKKTDYLKQSTLFDHDPISGKVTLTKGPPVISADQQEMKVETGATFDGLGRKIIDTDANKQVTTYQYNAYGSPKEIVYADGAKETFSYYKNGRLKSHTDASGLVIKYTYDIFGRMSEKEYFSDEKSLAKETFVYNAFGLLLEHVDKEKHLTEYRYDGAGRKISETISGRTTTYRYDSLGLLKSVNYSDVLEIEYDRDFLDHVLQERKLDPKKKKLFYKIDYSWDPDSKQIAITRYPHDKPAKETFAYDPFGRLTEHRNPLGHANTTTYEETSILKATSTDPNGLITIQTFDPYGRLSTLQLGTSYSEKRAYDSVGNLLQVKEGGLETRYSYNTRNRIQTMTRAFGSLDARTTSYTYYPEGEIATKALPNGMILTSTYTPLGYPLTVTSSDSSLQQTFDYTLNGHLHSAKNGHRTVTRKIDDFGNILSETVDGTTYTKTYDALDRVKTIEFPDQSSIAYTYSPVYLKTVMRLSAEGKELYTHTYDSYDLAGHVLTEQLIHDTGTVTHTWNLDGTEASITSPFFNQTITYEPGPRVQSISSDGTYEYNELSEITVEQRPENTLTYDYDPHYNRKKKNEHTLSCNSLDELVPLKYDLNGNLEENGNFQYKYDALNRLTEATSDDTQVAIVYDALDRRVYKKVNDLREFYLYDGNEELGSFTARGEPRDLKIPGLHQKPIALELCGKTFIPLCDYRGNIRRLIDPYWGHIAQSHDYTAFGEELPSIDTPYNPWRYSAKRLDKELGLYYFGKRFYSPTMGRWITTDPAGFVNGTNLYAYLFNDPLNSFDPDGTIAVALFGLSWGGSGAAASILTGPIGWTIGGGVVAVLALNWATNKLIESNTISQSTGSMINTATGGLVGSMINNMPIDYTGMGSSATQIASTGYGGYATTNHPNYKKQTPERKSSDEPGSPPVRGDRIAGDGTSSPAEGFDKWKGKGDPTTGNGSWVKGSGTTQESLHPDLNHTGHGKHWDYKSASFPNGARIYPDGTWELKPNK